MEKLFKKNGSTYNITLEDVLYIPDLYVNLFSLTKALMNDNVDICKVNNTLGIIFNKTNRIIFDKEIYFGTGTLLGIDIVPNINDYNAAMLSYSELHKLGHPDEYLVRHTAKYYKIPISGPSLPCENCAKGKMKKLKIPKQAEHNATKKGERISFDISSVKTISQGGNKFWLLIVDEFTNYCWSIFLSQKSDLPEKMIQWYQQCKAKYDFTIKSF